MLNIINIQFGNSKNNTNKVKKVYNQGNIITARPQTTKYPYKILSIRKFPEPNFKESKNPKTPKNNFIYKNSNLYTTNNICTLKKSFSFKEEFRPKKSDIKSKNGFNRSSFGKNNDIFYNHYEKNGNLNMFKAYYSTQRRNENLLSMKYNIKDFNFKNNKGLFMKRVNSDYKKKVSSFSMNKYIENYVDKTKIKDKAYNSTLNINENTYSLINNNDDDNIQIINFLSEVINTEILKKKNNTNFSHNNYYTTNNIYNSNINNKDFTRNLIIKRHNSNYQNKASLSNSKNANNEIKPIIINIKKKFGLIIQKTEHQKYKNSFRNNIENNIKFRKNQSSRLTTIKKSKENNMSKYRPLSATNKNVLKENNLNVEKNNKIDDNKNEKFIIKTKCKKKFKFNKNITFKNKKKKMFNSHDNSEFQKYLIDLNNKFNSPSNHKFENKKNSDIYQYIIVPKENEENLDEKENKNNKEIETIK